MSEGKIGGEDLLAAIVSGIENEDHKLIVVDAGSGIAPEIEAQMEADGYMFGYAPPAENGKRKLYFIRRPRPTMGM